MLKQISNFKIKIESKAVIDCQKDPNSSWCKLTTAAKALEIPGSTTHTQANATTTTYYTTTTKKPGKSSAVSTMKFSSFLMIVPVLPLAHLVYF